MVSEVLSETGRVKRQHFQERSSSTRLAHQLKDKAEAAYARGTLMEKRRKLMAAWAEYCEHNAIKDPNIIAIGAQS
jgi:hypothetical protein